MIRQFFFFFLLTTFLFSETRNIALDKLLKTDLKIKKRTFTIWLALNPLQQKEGLSFIEDKNLSNREGMLFIYPISEKRNFWMKNTLIDLDIAFIKTDGSIAQIYSMKRMSEKKFSSKEKVRYVLELKEGIFKEIPLHIGDKISFSKEIIDFSNP